MDARGRCRDVATTDPSGRSSALASRLWETDTGRGVHGSADERRDGDPDAAVGNRSLSPLSATGYPLSSNCATLAWVQQP